LSGWEGTKGRRGGGYRGIEKTTGAWVGVNTGGTHM